MADARQKIEDWRKKYNTFRPHRSLGLMTTEEFAEKQNKIERLTQDLVG
ncbi:MAG: transposase [bacterium]|nr:transposase [bacterium]